MTMLERRGHGPALEARKTAKARAAFRSWRPGDETVREAEISALPEKNLEGAARVRGRLSLAATLRSGGAEKDELCQDQ